MTPMRELIGRAWELTSARPQLHIFGTLSALFSILIGIPRLHYILRTDIIGWGKIYELLNEVIGSPVIAATTVGITYTLLLSLSFLVHTLSEGAIIAAVAKEATSGEAVPRRVAFGLGLSRFLAFVEFKLFTNFFSISSLTIWILLIDYYSAQVLGGVSVVRQFLPLTILIVLVVLVLSIGFTYSEVHFVVRKSTIVGALKRSIRLVAFYLSETVLLSVLLILIFARTIVNVVLIFLLPALVVAVTTFLTAQLAPATSLWILVGASVIAIWFAARISGVLLVFTNAVWTLTYLELDSRKDDVIIHDPPEPPAPKDDAAAPPAPPAPVEEPPPVQVLPGSGPSIETIHRPSAVLPLRPLPLQE